MGPLNIVVDNRVKRLKTTDTDKLDYIASVRFNLSSC